MTYFLDLSTTSGAPADGTSTNTATATLRKDGDYVASQTLTFLLTGTATFVDGTQKQSANTDVLGTATVSFTDTRQETVTVMVMSEALGVTKNAEATFGKGGGEAGDYQLTVTASSGAEPDGEATNDVTVKLTDKQGTPLARQIIDLSVSGSALFPEGSNTITVVTDKTGSHVAKISDTTEEKVTITAVLYDDEGSTVLAKGIGTSGFGQAASDYLLTVTASNGAGPNGLAYNTVHVTLRDRQGNPLPRQIIDLSVNKNALFREGSHQMLQVVTDAEGKHQTGITDEYEEVVTVSAQYQDDEANVLASARDTSGFGQAGSGFKMTVEADSGAAADGESANQVTVKLSHQDTGAPAHLAIIQIKASGSAIFTESGRTTAEALTDQEGKVTFHLTDTAHESVHLKAVYTGISAMVNAEGETSFGPAEHHILLVNAQDGAIADGKSTNQVTVTLKGGDGEPVEGADITLSVDGSALMSNGERSITVTTNAQGLALDTLTDTIVEMVTVSAEYNEVHARTTSSFKDGASETFEDFENNRIQYLAPGDSVVLVTSGAILKNIYGSVGFGNLGVNTAAFNYNYLFAVAKSKVRIEFLNDFNHIVMALAQSGGTVLTIKDKDDNIVDTVVLPDMTNNWFEHTLREPVKGRSIEFNTDKNFAGDLSIDNIKLSLL